MEPVRFQVGQRTVVGLDDGEFIMREGFLNVAAYQDRFAGDDGVARLPIGCFLVPGETTVLIDAGMGPASFGGFLQGGALLDQLAACGMGPADIDRVVVSHLHLDHCGWLATPEAEPVFPHADIWVGAGDWAHFVEGKAARLAEPVRALLRARAEQGRLTLIDRERSVVPGLTAVPAPGHTPGHTVFVVHDHGDRALILGDAMYCPGQLSDLDLEAVHDVDPVAARRTRAAIQLDLERHGSQAVGCHFPGLGAGRVIGGSWTASAAAGGADAGR